MKRQKLLLPFRNSTVIDQILGTLNRVHLDELIVVTDGRNAELNRRAASYPATIAFNPDEASGMLGSVRAGLRAMRSVDDWILVVLGDQPLIRASVIHALFDAARNTTSGIVVPVHRMRRGHPFLIASRFRAELMNSFDDSGLRGLLRAHGDEVREVEMSDPGILEDMDTPGDYERVRRMDDGLPNLDRSEEPGSGSA